MRRWPTWLLVGALVALGAVAAADALRGGDSVRRVEPTRAPGPLIPPNEPAGSAMSGFLYYTDERCVMHGLELPTLREARAPRWRRCDFSMSPTEPLPADREAAWQPQGGLFALDTPEGIELASAGSTVAGIRIRGRSPAFKPDGTFTYVLDDRIVEWTTDCPRGARLFTLPADNATARCREVVLTPADVRRALSAVRTSGPLRIEEFAWLTDTRLVVVAGEAEVSGYSQHVAVIEGGHAVGPIFSEFGQGLHVEASPRGNFFTAWFGSNLVTIRDREAFPVTFPALERVRAIAWSPDERWTVAATPRSVFVFRTDEGEARVRRLPIQARDLAWR
jgi:hypothetical protein